ncbi:MAG: hypothetical protein V2J12_00395 [Gammaproteobacteria bacterium]|nr:hypothetical protein [Gammaproteobacteria bacterium]
MLEQLALSGAELDQWQSQLAARTVAGAAAADVLFVDPPERVVSQHVRSCVSTEDLRYEPPSAAGRGADARRLKRGPAPNP